ncbi:peptidoglycan-binding domain-containing protein [Parasedimentitalea maritima]|uniref:peptidoglycan-binding domain-containing protein n=1 Tax=Parasedimentitalea maritima TaxID=2578117 RepID=UPI002482C38E|nr:peptidoglycan-binding domain-containing protein [Zongyanglinia marina]
MWYWRENGQFEKGSKGSGVKDLQTNLNKAGAKPKLAVDGIFGPITEKAVTVFQKKYGLKADGKAGSYTLASIKFGGKLPEMTVPDFTQKKKHFKEVTDLNRQNVASYEKMQEAIANLAKVASKEVAIASKSIRDNRKLWVEIDGYVDAVIDRQAEFDAELLKNPKNAAKLVKECEKIHKQVISFGSSNISPNVHKALASMDAVEKKLSSTTAFLKSERKAINKRKEE